MIHKKIIISVFLLALGVVNSYAQNIFDDLRGAEKRADFYYSRLSYTKAAQFYTLALQKKKNRKNYRLSMKAAHLYQKMAKYKEAKACFENALSEGYIMTAPDSIHYFNILKACGPTGTETDQFDPYSAKILSDLFRDSLYYSVEPVSFNTDQSEYCPVPVDKGIIYVADKEPASLVQKYNSINEGGFASLYFRERKESTWSDAIEMKIPLENIVHVGPVVFYNNQKEAILNVCVKDNKKPYRLLLYKAKYDSNTGIWSEIIPMPFNHKSYSVGHPAISEDGKTIFFVSDQKGSLGGTDLYTAHYLNDRWTKPVNMGTKINSGGDECYPYLNKDSVLFFSSDGRYGIGGMDIYYADLSFKDTLVLNMGAPVNSSLDDFSFHYDDINKTGYFSSNRNSNGNQDDLFLIRENKIPLTVFIKDDFNKKNLDSTEIQLWDSELNIPVKYFYGKQLNSIEASLRPLHRYKMIVKNEDYRNDTLLISTYDLKGSSAPLSETIYLKRKFIYYGNLMLSSERQRNRNDTSIIIINNLSAHKVDTLHCAGPSLILKLDAECNYIITSRSQDTLRYIFVETKSIKNLVAKPFYNMYLSSTHPIVFRVIIRKCTDADPREKSFVNSSLKVFDWVNGNEFKITPGPDGDFQFVVTDARLFDLFIEDNKIIFSKQEIRSGGDCIEFID